MKQKTKIKRIILKIYKQIYQNLFSIGGSNLANINFANISSQIKLVDTYKYFQSSLSNLASTINEGEKIKIWRNVRKIYFTTRLFFNSLEIALLSLIWVGERGNFTPPVGFPLITQKR